MPDYPFSEVDLLFSTDELDTRRTPSGRETIASARRRARSLRHRKKLWVASTSNQRKKRAIIGKNKHIDQLARRIIVNAKRHKGSKLGHENIPKAVLSAKKQPSILLDGLVPNRDRIWKSIPQRLKSRISDNIEVKDFCFLTNPIGTLTSLRQIAQAEAKCLEARIDFLDDRCHDIGPWLVLSAMREDMASIFTGGKISRSMSKVIDALGLKKPLRFDLQPNPDGHADVWAFPLRARRPAGTSTSGTQHLDPQASEKVGGDLCRAINRWLYECARMELTKEGVRSVKKIVGESLDNAERHSRREYANDGDWMITGFMAKRAGSNGPLFICQLAFLSVGSSIAETIKDAPQSTLTTMNNYVVSHKNSFPNQGRSAEHLRTIYALQDTVTRDHEAKRERRGGTGFRDIVCLFGDLAGSIQGQNDARLAIVSGNTCLHIDFSHCQAALPQPGKHFNIWLNAANERSVPPDQNAVKELESKFCGTLITMGFTLDPDYLKRGAHV